MTAELAVALDVRGAVEALRLVDALGEEATWYKVGPVLAVTDGPALVRELIARGKRVFLDLKWHDIPSTVAGAVAGAATLGVALATVHLAGGVAMLRSAVAARGNGLRLVGVGVLTSLNSADYEAVVGRSVTDLLPEQERLVRMGREAKLDGFVCAPSEARRLRAAWGEGAFVVTPGIRAPGAARHDQVRTATAAEAVAAGADLLVVGRAVTEAGEPRAALRRLLRETQP